MTAKSFVDTNVVLYTIGKDARKADIACGLVGANRTGRQRKHQCLPAQTLIHAGEGLRFRDRPRSGQRRPPDSSAGAKTKCNTRLTLSIETFDEA